MTTLIETLAGVAPGSAMAEALSARAEIMRLSEAAHDAVILPREPGGLGHGLRAALAARMARHAGDEVLARHYDGYLAHVFDPDVVPLAHPGSQAVDPRDQAVVRHADMLTLEPRRATRADIDALKAVGVGEPDIVRLAELAAFVSYQVRVIAGLRLLKDV